MKNVLIVIERCDAGYFPQACTDSYRCCIGDGLYSTYWSAKRGARRFLRALGATKWRFEGEEGAVSEAPEAPEPSVKGVNSWARWEATDSNGNVWEYEAEPQASGARWVVSSGRAAIIRYGYYCENWRGTLRRVNV